MHRRPVNAANEVDRPSLICCKCYSLEFSPVQSCEEKKVGPVLYRNCRYEPASLSEMTQDEYGMDVTKVKKIEDALAIFSKVSS